MRSYYLKDKETHEIICEFQTNKLGDVLEKLKLYLNAQEDLSIEEKQNIVEDVVNKVNNS